MIIRVFSIKDLKAGFFYEPILCVTDLVATRAFSEVANPDAGTMISKYPADYELWEIAWFDNLSGQFHNLDVPVCFGSAVQFDRKD